MSIIDSLYQQAASEKLAGNAYATFIEACISLYEKGSTIPEIKECCKEAEDKFVSETGESVKASWRSNKSIVVGAIEHGLKLRKADGTFRGKTDLQNELAMLRSNDCIPKRASATHKPVDYDWFLKMCQKAKANGVDVSAATTAVTITWG